MLFNSVDFLIFFPIVVLIYFLIPERARYLWLLGASYYFYMSWNPVYALLMLTSTLVTWAGALMICAAGKGADGNRAGGRRPDRKRACGKKSGGKGSGGDEAGERESGTKRSGGNGKRLKKWCLAACVAVNLGILFFFKYYAFTAESIEKIFGLFRISVRIPVFDILLPVGISFYTFQALGYVFDVFREEIPAEKNFLRYALFVSFFPQLVAGPIERSKNLMHQLREPHTFDAGRVKDGLLLMGWGFFQKLVLADRIAILVTDVYSRFSEYSGCQILLATVLFAFQIYCDFGGYSDIAVGAAQVMGFTLTKNFKSPYYAVTVSEFWRSWHISLTTWFRDYIYIPLGGNRCGRLKKYRNLLVTFTASGLWHGAGLSFVAWGALNGLYQVAGDLTRPLRTGLQNKLHIRTDCGSYRLLQGIVTFLFVDFAWLFFRADSLSIALQMIRHGVTHPDFLSLFDPGAMLGINTMVLPERNFFVMLLGLVLLLWVDYRKKQGTDFRRILARQNIWFRWLVYYGLIFTILVFGIYGPAYDASAFIYFQF